MQHRLTSPERRQAIIDTAIRLFAEKGFRGTTTRGLAAAVGVSEPVLYQHFRTKRELYHAILEAKAKEGNLRFKTQIAPLLEKDDDCAFFTQLAEFILDRYQADPQYARLLLLSALEGHELADLFFRRQVLAFYRMLSGYIRRRIEKGAFSALDPNLAARAFLGMIIHHGQVQLLYRDTIVKTSRKRVIEGIVETFLNGIKRSKARQR